MLDVAYSDVSSLVQSPIRFALGGEF